MAPPRVLSKEFHSACDPDVSIDATRVLFAGKKKADDPWAIYELTLDSMSIRQVTKDRRDCRSPRYEGPLFTLDAPKPWHELAFVATEPGILNESGSGPLTSLNSCHLDGSSVNRLTYSLSSPQDPCLLPDGRLLFVNRRHPRPELFAVNIDGTDNALFGSTDNSRPKHTPCVTTKGLAVFVEARDGAGCLACVTLMRPLHSYRRITQEKDGLFHSPSPLPDGRILVSRRNPDRKDTFGVYRLDPATGQCQCLYRDNGHHAIQARALKPRSEPDGRSSNVLPGDPTGKFYCLDVSNSDLTGPQRMPAGTVKRLRVLEGVPRQTAKETTIPRRLLGEVPVAEDGSFNIEVPANTPIQLQTLDANGLALRTCTWIWARNHEARGCIGCHEDGELVPDNRFPQAAGKESVGPLPPAQGAW